MYDKTQLEGYFKRIGLEYDPERKPDAGYLRDIQYAHCTTVPYENLDILRHIPLSLDPGALFDKIVARGRGGYCFELNGALGCLLRSVGFKVTDFMARYLRGEAVVPTMRRHRVLRVSCGGLFWLCDVGIGQSAPKYPLIMQPGLVQEQFGETYRFEKDDFYGWVLSDLHDGEWRRFFAFTEEPQLDLDYIMPSFWCEAHPDSPFTSKEMLSLKTAGGRITLDGNVYRVFDGGSVTEKTLGEDEKNTVIRERFGLKI